ncbi:MAG: PDZ domain-containing protein [Deltaproteobacteria bacterium]|nr:PDZ domain-containing protein [Deltaproteobacteria bacterium]
MASRKIGHLIADNKRLRDIEYALTTSTAQKCGLLSRPRLGVLFFRADSFEDDAIRESVSEDYALGERLGVIYVVPGGSFDRADIRAGDQLLEVDGKATGTADEFLDLMLETSERDSIEVLLQRGGERLERSVRLAAGCPVQFALSTNAQLIARRTTRLMVIVPMGVMRLVDDDDALAVVLAHELAHALFDDKEESWPVQEARADRYGLLIAASAGYEVAGAVAYWEAVASEYPWLIDDGPDSSRPLWKGWHSYAHFGIAQRIAAIRSTVREIEARLAEGASSP